MGAETAYSNGSGRPRDRATDIVRPLISHSSDVSSLQAISVPTLIVEGILIACFGAVAMGIYSWIKSDYAHVSSNTPLIAFCAAILFCSLTRILGSQNSLSVSTIGGRIRGAMIAWVMAFLFLAFVAFALKVGAEFSRGAILGFFVSGLPIVILSRVLIPPLLLKSNIASPYRRREAIIVSSAGDPLFEMIALGLRSRGCLHIHTIQFNGGCEPTEWTQLRRALLNRILKTARMAGSGDIFILGGTTSQIRLESIISGLRLVPRAIHFIPDRAVAALVGAPVQPLGSAIAIQVKKSPLSPAQQLVKRVTDVIISSLALAFVAPLFLIIAIAIKFDTAGPVFFRQRRAGYRGQPFRIFKFRTMSVLEDGDHVAQARNGDERVTKVGKWLRMSSLDELPQLFNIALGEMSLVGPRPHALAHDKIYADLIENYELRQHVKPGLTGWAQVNGFRGETPSIDLMYRRIEFDLWYSSNASLMLDWEILLRTPLAIWSQRNAY